MITISAMGSPPIGVTPGRRAKHEQYVEMWGLGLGIAVSPYIGVARWKTAFEPGPYPQGLLELLTRQLRLMPDGANFRWRLPAWQLSATMAMARLAVKTDGV